MADLPECPNCSQNADVVELVYTHGLGPCATSMWVRVPPSAQKFRKRVALQAGAPALGAGNGNAMEVQVLSPAPFQHPYKNRPDFQGGFVFHPQFRRAPDSVGAEHFGRRTSD